MLKKILKWTGILLVSVLVMAAIFYAVVYFSTEWRINKVYNVNVQTLSIPVDSGSYQKGKHIAQNRGCMGCHGTNLGGHEVFMPEGSPVGTLVARNITSGKGGIQYTDADWIRLLRHGINKEGKSAWFMPAQEICHLSNEEMAALICFVKQQPPVDNTVPDKKIKPLGRLLFFLDKFPLLPAEMIDHNASYKDMVEAAVTPEYGAYLATVCQGCHSPNYKGAPPRAPQQPAIPDISATGEIGQWTEADFVNLFHTGKKPDGTQLSEAMPFKEFTYTDDELKAIYAFLRELK
ncbi:MAG: c-type cytochrome [Bacteroidetes bacterium]|nr:c-type cytochrome [Bacteroidota bacterium]